MNNNGFDFITDDQLKKTIISSIDFSSVIWLLAEKIPENNRDELYRMMILYSATISEALLGYYLESKKTFIEEEKFTHTVALPKDFKNDCGEMVVSFRKKQKRVNPDFAELIKFLNKKLGSSLTKRLNKIRETRNTLHLTKKRTKLKEKDVEFASNTLFLLVNKIKKIV